MFAAGKLGGGDVKLLAATGLWFDFHGALWMLICVAISGGILALVVLILRMIGWSENLRTKVVLLRPKAGIPYGVAIAAGSSRRDGSRALSAKKKGRALRRTRPSDLKSWCD